MRQMNPCGRIKRAARRGSIEHATPHPITDHLCQGSCGCDTLTWAPTAFLPGFRPLLESQDPLCLYSSYRHHELLCLLLHLLRGCPFSLDSLLAISEKSPLPGPLRSLLADLNDAPALVVAISTNVGGSGFQKTTTGPD